jgi:methylene-fatty-acyl-phospholipid synthase
VLQFSAVAAYIACLRPTGLCFDIMSITLLQWLAFLLLVGYGQALNVGIFKAIGHEGVYYGFKLGHTIPWFNGWPFDSVSHPQYVGSVLTVWGVLALLWSQVAPAQLVLLGVYWTALYVVTGFQEEYL